MGVARGNAELPPQKDKGRTIQYNTNRKLTYNLIRWRAASHSALQFALGVLDGMLCGVHCDDRRAWYQAESTNEV